MWLIIEDYIEGNNIKQVLDKALLSYPDDKYRLTSFTACYHKLNTYAVKMEIHEKEVQNVHLP